MLLSNGAQSNFLGRYRTCIICFVCTRPIPVGIYCVPILIYETHR